MAAGSRVRALVGVADQVLYSITNFLLTILVARYSRPAEFGLYSIFVATFLILSAANRGVCAEPLIIRFSAAAHREWSHATSATISVAFIFGLLVGLPTAIVTAVTLSGTYREIGLVFAAAMPVLFVQDFLRYAALANRRPIVALANDGCVAVLQVVASALAIASGHATAPVFVAIWALAGAAGALVALALLNVRPRWRRSSGLLHDPTLSTRLCLDNVVTQVGQQGTAYAVAAVSGLSAAAGLRAAQTVFTPPAVLTLGMQIAVTPELVRLRQVSMTRMRRALYGITALLVAVALVYLGVVLVIPDRPGLALFGASWLAAKPLLVFVGLAIVGGTLSNAAIAGLRVLADARRTLQARSVALVLAVGLIVPGAVVGGARGAAIALAIATPLQAVIWWAQFTVSFRAERAAVGRQRLAGRWQRLVDSAPAAPGSQGQDDAWIQVALGADAIEL